MNPIPSLTTTRLILRPFAREDAAAVQRLAGEWEIADTTLNVPHPYEDGMAEAWIATHAPDADDGKGVTWAITTKADGAIIGAMGIPTEPGSHRAELGYWIGKPFWSQGYCTEAAEAVLRHAFTDMELERIHCYHLSRNPASGRVMRKLGMRHEGTRRKHARKWGVPEDLESYGILKTDWQAEAVPPPAPAG